MWLLILPQAWHIDWTRLQRMQRLIEGTQRAAVLERFLGFAGDKIKA